MKNSPNTKHQSLGNVLNLECDKPKEFYGNKLRMLSSKQLLDICETTQSLDNVLEEPQNNATSRIKRNADVMLLSNDPIWKRTKKHCKYPSTTSNPQLQSLTPGKSKGIQENSAELPVNELNDSQGNNGKSLAISSNMFVITLIILLNYVGF